MTLIVCVDDDMGLTFAGRRQSRDRVLFARIRDKVAGREAWTSAYTASALFPDDAKRPTNWHISDIPARAAAPGEVCFAEDLSSREIANAASNGDLKEIWMYHWNRAYPGTDHFPAALLSDGWQLVSSCGFHGCAHPTILEEVLRLTASTFD